MQVLAKEGVEVPTRNELTNDGIRSWDVPEGHSALPSNLVAPGKSGEVVDGMQMDAKTIAPEEIASGSVKVDPDEVVMVDGKLIRRADIDLSDYVKAGTGGYNHEGKARRCDSYVRRGAGVIKAPVALSPAAARLAAARNGDLKPTQKRYEGVEFRRLEENAEPEIYFIKRLRWNEVQKVHIESARNVAGVLDLREDGDDMRVFGLSVLFNCVYLNDQGHAFFANPEEACAWVDSLEDEIQRLVQMLVDTAVEVNPLLLPKLAWREMPAPMPSPSASPTLPEENRVTTNLI